jgi:predicted DsbA family dithiol-disulfide isomerase
MIEDAGLIYNPPEVVPNSMHSLELAEFARDVGLFREVHVRLFDAYWSQQLNIGDLAVLENIADTIGLDTGEAQQAFADGRYKERIGLTTRAALDLGAGGVPTWLIDDKLLISGARPHDVFEEAMTQLGHKPIGGGIVKPA